MAKSQIAAAGDAFSANKDSDFSSPQANFLLVLHLKKLEGFAIMALNLETLQRLFAYLGHHLLFDLAVVCVCILIVSAITCMMSPDQEHDCFFHRQVY